MCRGDAKPYNTNTITDRCFPNFMCRSQNFEWKTFKFVLGIFYISATLRELFELAIEWSVVLTRYISCWIVICPLWCRLSCSLSLGALDVKWPIFILRGWLVAWHGGRTSVFSQRTFPVMCSTCSWRVTTYVGKPSTIGQPTRPAQPFVPSGSINE